MKFYGKNENENKRLREQHRLQILGLLFDYDQCIICGKKIDEDLSYLSEDEKTSYRLKCPKCLK